MADSYTFFNVYNEIEQGEGRPAKYSSEELEKFKDGSDPNLCKFNWYDFIITEKWDPRLDGSSVSGNIMLLILSFIWRGHAGRTV